MWGEILKRDLLGESREEDRFHTKEEVRDYIKSEIEKQGENVVIRDLDVSLVEDLSGLFRIICKDVKTLDLSGWKTSNVKNMNWMFSDCESIKSLAISRWDTSNVEEMSHMFNNCDSLESLNLSDWDTSNVKDMGWMFYDCPAPYKVVNNQIVKK